MQRDVTLPTEGFIVFKSFIDLPAALAISLLMAPAASAARPIDLSALSAEIDKRCAEGTFSGVILIRQDDRDLLEKSCGQADIVNGIPNTRATRFKIYSTSKLPTALVVMKLAEQKVISLDAPITRYITDTPKAWDVVTVRHLLNHSSGITDLTEQLVYHYRTDGPAAMRETLAALTPEQAALKTAPGTAFAYSNFGFELLAELSARATGKPFAALVETLLLAPAGMKTAKIEAPNMLLGHPLSLIEDGLAIGYNGSPEKLEQATNFAFIQLGAGAMHATIDDFIALDAALSNNTILSQQSFDEMRAAHNRLQDPNRANRQFGLGIILQQYGDVRIEGHTGGNNGYISSFQRYPEAKVAQIVLTNRGFVRTGWLDEMVAAAIAAAR